ncbi:MAG TPA: S41 family peptidase [Chitinophagaceae bacterium]|nr:S41 family peptidase [Chitinophagaceae bacterium]
MKQIFACILTVLALPLYAQWNIECWEEKREVRHNLMPANATYSNHYTFFGSSRLLSENVVTKSITPFVTGQNNQPSWQINLAQPLQFTTGSANAFYFNFYSENISACTFIFESANGQCLRKKVDITKDKYRLPIEFSVANENLQPCQEGQKADSLLDINKITIVLNKRDNARDFKCIVGECNIFDQSLGRKTARGAFFYEFTRDKKHEAPQYVFKDFGSAYPISYYTSFTNLTIPEYYFIPDSAKHKNVDWQLETLKLMKHFIQVYPYFKEHNIDKASTLQKADAIIASPLPFKEKVGDMNKLMKSLHDGHFYVEAGSAQRPLIGPILARKINDDIQVVGIFDEDLKKSVQLGMKITSINGVPVDKYVDSSSALFFGSENERRDLAVARLFYRAQNDSMRITLASANGASQELMVRFKKSSAVPSNFRPEHMRFAAYGNNWGYVKLNRWAIGDWISFFNLADTLKQMQGIIFDLRGNGGGAEIEAIRILSCFIKKPVVFSYDAYGKTMGPRTAVPNKFLDLSHLKIIVLVDGRTACASELFAAALRKYCSAKIVGSERTNGAYANAAYMYLPYDVVVKTNIMSKTYFDADRRSVEHNGLKPDLLVPITHYKDLFPYDDKVLANAVQLTGTISGNAKR